MKHKIFTLYERYVSLKVSLIYEQLTYEAYVCVPAQEQMLHYS